jgi:hypothetical protein
MSLRPDGSYRCDRCDTDVENGSVQFAAVVSDLQESEQDDVAALAGSSARRRSPPT